MSRLNYIIHKMAQHQVDAFLIFDANNITYLSGFTGHAATALVCKEKSYLLTDYRYFEQAKNQCTDFSVVCRDRVNQSLAALVKELLSQHHVNQLAFETDHTSHGAWLNMAKLWPDVDCLAVSRWVEASRYIKSDIEIKAIQHAAQIADQALENLTSVIKPGVSERELAIELEYQMSVLGSEQTSFPTIMLAAERSALPHGIPSHKKLTHGDLLLIDFGAVINGYHSDMTRTFVLGKASQKQRDVYHIVLAAQQAALDALNEGIVGQELYLHAKNVLDQSPYAQFQGEGLGHGLGLDLHEFPFIGLGCDLKLHSNCVVTIEPGIYIPGWGGVRIEDDVYLSENGLISLTSFPKHLIEL